MTAQNADSATPEMNQRVLMEAYVNGYSLNTKGSDDHPIVSLYLPDGHQGFHGPSGTTIWVTRDEFDRLLGAMPRA